MWVSTKRAGPRPARRHGPRAIRGAAGARGSRGVVAVITMLYMLLLTTLTLALFYAASYNTQTAVSFSDIARAHAAAESGLRWIDYRFQNLPRPVTDKGKITATLANTLWPTLRDNLIADLRNVRAADKTFLVPKQLGNRMTVDKVSIDASTGATFDVEVKQLTASDGWDERFIRVTVTGRFQKAVRSLSMIFKMDKKVKFAIVGKVPVQVGRNTIIDGPIAMGTPGKYPPIWMLSDFQHFDAALKTKIVNFETYLRGTGSVSGKVIPNHRGYDGRISVNNKDEAALAAASGYTDYNADGFIDEYDVFLKQYDKNGDKAISKAEFTNPATGKLYDDNLFFLMDNLSAPLLNEDKNGNGLLDAGEDINGNGILDVDPPRSGYNDGIIDNRDGYAKIRGGLTLSTNEADWAAELRTHSPAQVIPDMIVGPVANLDPTQPGVKFSASPTDIFDLNPANFEQATLNYKGMTGPSAGVSTKTATLIANKVLAAADANGTSVAERTPYGSSSWQATYQRPVFKNLTLRNVQIPKGLNALFDNCIFEGVTYVDGTRNITTPSGAVTYNKDDGMTWAKRMISGTFANTTTLTSTNSRGFTDGNNLRFNDCTFSGPLIGAYATAYTHFANTWEFTGATLFNNKVDQTATLVSPQVNIEMGSFTNPALAPSTMVGVVVAGNIDIRGSTVIDGSLIVTGDGAGNTTLSYWGNNDGASDPGAMPEGGYGRISLRYNPYRAMPDGINTSVDLLPQVFSYQEGVPK
jgi:Tfp pilus assembly protein PilX